MENTIFTQLTSESVVFHDFISQDVDLDFRNFVRNDAKIKILNGILEQSGKCPQSISRIFLEDLL